MLRAKDTLHCISKWFVNAGSHRRLWLVFGVAFLLRLLVVGAIATDPQQSVQIDSPSYLYPAHNMLFHGKFSQATEPPYTPDVLRTPGYPTLLALCMLLFGPEPYVAIVAIQALIGALISVGMVLLGEKLFDMQTGLIAGLLHTVAPMQILMVGWVLTETLFTAFLVGGLLLLTSGLPNGKWWLYGLGGMVFGLASLTRPIGLLLLLPLVLALPLHTSPGKREQRVLLPLLGYVLVAGLWMGRNYILFGRSSLSSAMDYHLYYYAVPGFMAERQGISLDEARQKLNERLAEYPPLADSWPLAQEGAVARQVIMEHPAEFLWFNGVESLKGLLRPGFSFMLFTLSDEGSTEREPTSVFAGGDFGGIIRALLQESGWVLALHAYMLVFTWSLLGLSLVGLVTLIIQRRWFLVVLLGLLSAFMLYPPGISANARYRSPVEPLLILLAVAGFCWLRDRARGTLIKGELHGRS